MQREQNRRWPGNTSAAVVAWVLYDWGYGAFTTVVSTFVIATYVTRAVAADPAAGAADWGFAQALAGALIALLAVPLGALGDQGGGRRALLAGATAILVAATFALWTVRPHQGDLFRALGLVVVATVAFEVALTFYNAMLPDLAPPGRVGRLSMLGWAAGYGGGLCCLALCLGLLSLPPPLPFGLDRGRLEDVRACALIAGAWLAVFAWPVCVFGPPGGARRPWGVAMRAGLAALRDTWRDAVRRPGLGRFIVARALYTDGLVTLFAFGGIYAASRFGLDARAVLLFGIRLTLAAGIGTLACAFVEDRIGAKAMALASLAALFGFGAAVLLAPDLPLFLWAATALGLFVGPVQAASRSMMAQLAPAGARAAYFGLFALSGRVSAFAGPLALGLVTRASGSLRLGMAVILLFLLAGGLLLARVPYQAPIRARRARSVT